MALADPTVAADDEIRTPKTIEDGFVKMEEVLGTFASKDARQFRKSLDNEITQQPDESAQRVRTNSKGQLVIGNPYRLGGAAAFDMVEAIKRTVERLDDAESASIIRRQQRYSVVRYTLRVNEQGVWEFDSVYTAHSIPWAIGRPYMIGAVRWLPQGFTLTGIATDDRYAADGSLIRAATVGEITFTRQGEELSLEDTWQGYHRAKSPAGVVLPFPDMSRPIGEPHAWLKGTASRD
jgi:hypothetical protein